MVGNGKTRKIGQDERLFTFADAGAYMKLSRTTIYRLVKAGDLRVVRIRGARRFRRRDLDALIARAARSQSGDRHRECERSEDQ